jgi:hypothetical protein
VAIFLLIEELNGKKVESSLILVIMYGNSMKTERIFQKLLEKKWFNLF